MTTASPTDTVAAALLERIAAELGQVTERHSRMADVVTKLASGDAALCGDAVQALQDFDLIQQELDALGAVLRALADGGVPAAARVARDVPLHAMRARLAGQPEPAADGGGDDLWA
ncbi:MAG: hypothetical protein O2905_05830 [Proteobacteria bacterium]|nr:hypothetical protein [Pseudomonadota bacterium]